MYPYETCADVLCLLSGEDLWSPSPQSRERVLWPHYIQGSQLYQEPALRNLSLLLESRVVKRALPGWKRRHWTASGLQTLP